MKSEPSRIQKKIFTSGNRSLNFLGTIVFGLTSLASQLCFAQREYLFENYNYSNGIRGPEIHSIYKDQQGFVWLGAESGLYRFDGIHFDAIEDGPFQGAAITHVTGDNQNNLWIASEGVACINKKTNSSKKFGFTDVNNRLTPDPNCKKIIVDHKGRVWALGNSLYILIDTLFKPAATIFPALKSLTSKTIIQESLKLDSLRNGLWVGSADGLHFFDFKSNELYSRHFNPLHLPVFNTAEEVFCIAVGKEALWFTGRKSHIYRYQFSGEKNLDGILEKGKDIFDCAFLFEDSQQRLWISTWSRKMYIQVHGAINSIPSNSNYPYDLPALTFNTFYEDYNQNIWFATYRGVSKLPHAPLISKMFHTGNDNFGIINNLKAISDTLLWVCTDFGLVKLNYETGDTTRYLVPNPTASISSNRFFDVEKIGNKWWCGTGQGIQLFDPITNRFTPFSHYSGKSPKETKSVFWIKQDTRGFIWFGVWLDAIYRYDPRTDVCLRMNDSEKYGDVPLINVHCMYEDSTGKVWFGTENSGVRSFNYTTNKFFNPIQDPATRNFLSNIKVFSIIEDRNKNLVLGTIHHGIVAIDRNGKIVDQYTMAEGLKNNNVSSVLYDKKDNLWVLTTEGVSRFTHDKKKLGDIHVNFGAFSIFVNIPLFYFRDNIHITSLNAIAVINGDYDPEQKNLEPPVISGMKVNDKQHVLWGTEKSTIIPEGANFITFTFASPNHKQYSTLRYKYRLTGFENTWHETQNNTGQYSHVPPGTYTFTVRASSNGKDWVDSHNEVSISVLFLWWQTIWFKVSVVTFAIFVSVASWKIYRARRKENMLKNTVAYFARNTNGEFSPDEICYSLSRACVDQMKIDYCGVYLFNETTKEYNVRASNSTSKNLAQFEVTKSKIESAILTGNPSIDTSSESKISTIFAPILEGNNPIGLIQCSKRKSRYFGKADEKALTTIASINATKLSEAKAMIESRERKLQLLEMDKLLAETKFMALRSQMNPHFIFNCLNNIESYFVSNRYEEARYYLQSFAKLLRHVLLNASDNFITLEEESKMLEYYMKLEQMRFENIFEYLIINDNVDMNEVSLPSMLLQPFVENSIVHGFNRNREKGKIIITFKIVDDVLHCKIEDNGIGRVEAQKIKKSKPHGPESKGLKLTEDRLLLLNNQGFYTSLTFSDKYDQNNIALGTIVELLISVE